jgi:hypothetical protein
METMIVARFFRTADLILQTENDGGRVGNGKWFHSSMKPQIHRYAQLLMSLCLPFGFLVFLFVAYFWLFWHK